MSTCLPAVFTVPPAGGVRSTPLLQPRRAHQPCSSAVSRLALADASTSCGTEGLLSTLVTTELCARTAARICRPRPVQFFAQLSLSAPSARWGKEQFRVWARVVASVAGRFAGLEAARQFCKGGLLTAAMSGGRKSCKSTVFALRLMATCDVSNRQIYQNLGVQYFADHIRVLTESCKSKLADEGRRCSSATWHGLLPTKDCLKSFRVNRGLHSRPVEATPKKGGGHVNAKCDIQHHSATLVEDFP